MNLFLVKKKYFNENTSTYVVFPYNLDGTLDILFGFDFKNMEWKYHFVDWYTRFTQLFRMIKMGHFSEAKAEKHAEKLNNRVRDKRSGNYGV